MRISLHLQLATMILAFSGALGADGSPSPRAPQDPPTWVGEVSVDKPVAVEAGQTLRIDPGAHVIFKDEGRLEIHGRLLVAGTAEAPIQLSELGPPAGARVALRGASALAEVRHALIRVGGQAFSVQAGALVVRDTRFESNAVAVRLDVKAMARIEDCAFRANQVAVTVENGGRAEIRRTDFTGNQGAIAVVNSSSADLEGVTFEENTVGLALMHAGDVVLRDCRFRKQATAIRSEQTGRGPHVLTSSFIGNKTAMEGILYSHALVEASEFLENDVGVSADQFCSPLIRYNNFTRNKLATSFDKKSNGRLEYNHFSGNEIALFADFSSYPDVQGNAFEENTWHVRLGPQQSADFERRFGSGGLTRGGAQSRGPGRPGRVPAPMRREAPDLGGQTFSVANNAWDRDTRREMEAGPDANITRFWDGKDQGQVRYEGFGEDRYAVDAIVFLPAAESGKVAVGPRAWTPCGPTAPAPAPAPARTILPQEIPPARPERPTPPEG